MTCVQIAGLIARRILCYVKPGDALARGQRYGFIRFGSRVDVYLRAGSHRRKSRSATRFAATRRCSRELPADDRISTAAAARRMPSPLPLVLPERAMADFDTQRALQKNRIRRRGIYLLPNLFTTAALFAGFYAIVQAMNLRFEQAAVAIFVAMVLDGLDGRVARLTRTQSAFGAEYDSLSDMVSFGAAPALIVYEWALKGMGKLGWIAAFVYVARAPRCGSPASTRCSKSPTSAGSRACPARRPRRWSRDSSGSSTTTTSTRSACAGGRGSSRSSRASRWSATSRTTASRRST